jgi:ribosomal protein S18 acetylase RimI-like enzyme
MTNPRPLRWPNDRERLRSLDTSYTTDRIYRVEAIGLSFRLEETVIIPALQKDYRFADHVDGLTTFDYVVVAELATEVTGVAAITFETWNRRAVLGHCYIAPAYRGQGIGRSLIDNVVQAAHQRHARCLWLETQNINYGAIQFYQRVGFTCCGLDLALYDPRGPANGETALFFVRYLE